MTDVECRRQERDVGGRVEGQTVAWRPRGRQEGEQSGETRPLSWQLAGQRGQVPAGRTSVQIQRAPDRQLVLGAGRGDRVEGRAVEQPRGEKDSAKRRAGRTNRSD